MIDRRNLPLSALRAFESAAEHLHMGKAGENLGVTHGAVSHQVRLLEDRLGAQLFSRANNSLALTPAGKRLFSAVSQGFDRILDGTRYLDPDTLSGPLIIGCTQTIALSWAAQHICEFYRRYPTIQISVREIQSNQPAIPRDIDIAICYGEPRPDDRKVIKLGAPLLFPVCNPILLQKHQTKTKASDVLHHTLIHDQQVSWAKWMEKHGVDSSRASSNISFANTSQALHAAIKGAGIALSNALEAQEYVKEGSLVRFIDKSIEEEAGYFLLTPGEDNQTIKTQIFQEWIVRACDPTHRA